MRLSVTDQCNLSCCYCKPNGTPYCQKNTQRINFFETLEVARHIDSIAGINKIRITGGEPLLAPNVATLVHKLHQQFPKAELCLTTNGILLKRFVRDLKQAGLHRINISLDAANNKSFAQITGGGRFEDVWDSILATQQQGYAPKLNCVLLRSLNSHQLVDLVHTAAQLGVEIRFIELMPMGRTHAFFEQEFVSGEQAFLALCDELPCLGPRDATSTAKRYAFKTENQEVIVGFVTPMSHPFCAGCDRLRLDCFGNLIGCLRSQQGINVIEPLRKRQWDQVENRIERVWQSKKGPMGQWAKKSMAAIGG